MTDRKKSSMAFMYDSSTFLSFDEIRDLDSKYVLSTYARLPVSFRYGSGEYLYDTHGNQYIDFLSGIAVTSLGHSNSDLIDAIRHQADHVWHTSNIFYNQQQAILAKTLIDISFPGKVFFCNSGTEANEAAFKLMRAYGVTKSKSHIVALSDSFHGRTMGSLSLTGQDKIRSGFGDVLQSITFVEPNNLEGLLRAVNNDTCGIILESIQGEGGVLPLTQEFLAKARELADMYEAILVIDEVQTGIGRTGTWFAYQQFNNIIPDVVTIAKALGSGFPIGAMIVSKKYENIFTVGSHGSTFGGNHLATRVAYETLRCIEANAILRNVNSISAYLMRALLEIQKKYPNKVMEVRGMGLILGVVLANDIPSRPIMEKALSKHLLIGRAGDTILRLLPPLNIRKSVVDIALEKIEQLISEI